jgi:hypothetical protein
VIEVVAAGVVRRWVALYTSGLPTELREDRRADIEADLWGQLEEAGRIDRSALSTAIELFTRWLAGILADLSWRLEHQGGRAMTTAALPIGGSKAGALGVGIATVIAGVGLAGLLLLFYVAAQAVAPADPYYIGGAGVWLVLIGIFAEFMLAAALVGFAVRYSGRFHGLVVGTAATGAFVAAVAALGGYQLIVVLPVATVFVAWNLAWLRIAPAWLAAAHTLAGVSFMWVTVSLFQTYPGSLITPIFLLTTPWPLTLTALGVAVISRDRQRQPAPAI